MQEIVIFLAFILFMSYNVFYIESAGVFMKDILKSAWKIFYLLIIANIMSLFLIISFNFITIIAFTEEIGYIAYGVTEDNEEQVALYTHYFADGEDTKIQEHEDMGYTVTTSAIRSNPSKKADVVSKIVTSVFCLIIVISISYGEMLKLADKDRTAVKYKGQKEQKSKGFIVGAAAMVPAVLFLLVLTVLKSGAAKTFPLLIYAYLNTYLYDLICLITGSTTVFGALTFWQILLIFLLLTILPIICGISYILGYKSFSLSEKIIYKKN